MYPRKMERRVTEYRREKNGRLTYHHRRYLKPATNLVRICETYDNSNTKANTGIRNRVSRRREARLKNSWTYREHKDSKSCD